MAPTSNATSTIGAGAGELYNGSSTQNDPGFVVTMRASITSRDMRGPFGGFGRFRLWWTSRFFMALSG